MQYDLDLRISKLPVFKNRSYAEIWQNLIYMDFTKIPTEQSNKTT